MPDPTMPGQSPVLETLREVMRRTALSRSTIYASTIYAFMANEAFPRPVRVGTPAVCSIADEIDAWITTRPHAGGR